MDFSLSPNPFDIALRLALALAASAAIGFDRSVHGHVAGLRTTMLVGFSAAVAMVLANMLLTVAGKTDASFATMDPMRLPLGVLTGVGFIGGGAILRRADLVTGVTTAATLWTVTIIGLCLGAGEIGLGVAASAAALLTLRTMKWAEAKISRRRRAMLQIEAEVPPATAEIEDLIGPAGFKAQFHKLCRGASSVAAYEVSWMSSGETDFLADLVRRVDQRYKVVSLEILPEGER